MNIFGVSLPVLRRVESSNKDIVAVVDSLAEFIVARDAVPPRSFGSHAGIQKLNYQARIGEHVLVDPTASPLTIQLPSIKKAETDAHVTITNTTSSTNAITVQPSDSGTVNGSPTLTMVSGRRSVTMVAISPKEWVIVGFF